MKDKITTVIVDDEPHAREAIRRALEKLDVFNIVAECENGLQAVKAVNELRPATMFLDIQMPKLDGFDVLELLGDQAPYVVFVTAYDEFAVKAFEANAIDYLLKPLDPDRLQKSVDKLTERVAVGDNSENARIVALVNEEKLLQRVLVRDGSEVHVIAVRDICYMESANDYVAIHTENATHIKLDRLNKLEEKLDPRQFCRIHRSYLLNINYLVGIETETKDTKAATLTTGKQLPISRKGYGNLKQLL